MSRPPERSNELFDVVGVGANAVDTVHVLPAAPEAQGPHAKMRIREHFVMCGGQTTTALATCAAMGLRARYVGVLGSDDRGQRLRRELEERGLDLAHAIVRDAPNQFAIILIDERTGERIVLWDRDERLLFREGELDPEIVTGARLVHVDDVDQEAAITAARFARARGIPVTSDIDILSDRTPELLEHVTVPIFAEHVPPRMTGVDDPETALRKLARGKQGLFCVTLGDRGALAVEGDRVYHQPAFHVEARDTTGAGDVFRGGFIYAMLAGWPVDEILRFANAAAAVSCTRLGALNGAPTLDEVRSLMGPV